jgi:hypothetical protein
MFDAKASADGLWVGLSMLFLVLTFQYVFLPTLVDGFRDRLFAIRRDLFRLVAANRIAPTDPAYVNLRRTLNCMIAYAGKLTFLRGFIIPALTMAGLSRRAPQRHPSLRDEAITAVTNEELREELRAIDDRMANAVAIHVMVSSPVAWVAVLFALPVAIVIALIAGTVETLQENVVAQVSDRVECEAELLAVA